MDKNALYVLLEQQARALLQPRFGLISNAANLAALIYRTLPDINWAGFYFLDGEILRLGPFQGAPACTEIPLGKGVCGMAISQKQTLVVPDVHAFDGHIACDPASRSEIVIPLLYNNEAWGVLDIDAPILHRFDTTDQKGLEKLSTVFIEINSKKFFI